MRCCAMRSKKVHAPFAVRFDAVGSLFKLNWNAIAFFSKLLTETSTFINIYHFTDYITIFLSYNTALMGESSPDSTCICLNIRTAVVSDGCSFCSGDNFLPFFYFQIKVCPFHRVPRGPPTDRIYQSCMATSRLMSDGRQETNRPAAGLLKRFVVRVQRGASTAKNMLRGQDGG